MPYLITGVKLSRLKYEMFYRETHGGQIRGHTDRSECSRISNKTRFIQTHESGSRVCVSECVSVGGCVLQAGRGVPRTINYPGSFKSQRGRSHSQSCPLCASGSVFGGDSGASIYMAHNNMAQ